MHNLQSELNSMAVRHREELYWLKLELDTTRLEKEAVESRMAELYRDMQELDDIDKSPSANGRGGNSRFNTANTQDMQRQVQKFEKMVRIMNNQIGLLRSSTDAVVKRMKDEISDLIDEKTRSELGSMNRLNDLEKENRELRVRLEVAEQGQKAQVKDAPLPAPLRLSNPASSTDMKRLQGEVKQLRQQIRSKDQELVLERKTALDTINKLHDEKLELSQQVDRMQQEIQMSRSPEVAASAMDLLQQSQSISAATLDRVAQLWEQADDSIHELSDLVAKLEPNAAPQSAGRERMLTVLETASLVHGQIKVSLMLVELKLRNSLITLWNDRSQLGPLDDSDEAFQDRLSAIQAEVMITIELLGEGLRSQISSLEAQSQEVTATLTHSIESRIGELQRMQNRQSELQEMIANLHASEQAETREVVNEDGTVDMFVSRKVLERLQKEVLQIVDKVREKNEEIGRLTMTIEELKVRDRALMDELKRLMQEQARVEMEERRRRMEAQALRDAEADDDDTDSEYDDCSSSAFVEDSVAEDLIEESVMEETVIE